MARKTEAPAVEPDIAAALSGDPTAHAAFEALAPSHRNEYLVWIADAKKADTRTRRLAKMLVMLRSKRSP